MPFITIREFCRWIGASVFEIWMHVLGCLIFSVLLVIKLETTVFDNISWWIIFCPILVASAFHGYFTLIVFVRQYLEDGSVRSAATRALLIGMFVGLLVTFQILLCLAAQKVLPNEGYSVVFCPVYVMMALLLVKACMLMS